jgi:hypothetical protein
MPNVWIERQRGNSSATALSVRNASPRSRARKVRATTICMPSIGGPAQNSPP